jgi:hypothetical protein
VKKHLPALVLALLLTAVTVGAGVWQAAVYVDHLAQSQALAEPVPIEDCDTSQEDLIAEFLAEQERIVAEEESSGIEGFSREEAIELVKQHLANEASTVPKEPYFSAEYDQVTTTFRVHAFEFIDNP